MTTTMITACPACTTVFRINDEQLAARDGRVRCGQCATVFDARAVLRIDSVDSALESSGPEEDLYPQTGVAAFPEIEQIADAQPVAAHDTAPEPAPVASARELPTEPPAKPAPAPRGRTPALRTFEPKWAPHRAAWATLVALLALSLMAQMAFHYRGEVVLLFPEARPVIEDLCAHLACRVPLPRHAEMISIESSDLQADPANPSVMVLTATLRNRATFAQSHPSLELTLTDAQDQPLARRVLGAPDYLGPAANGKAGFKANSELSIKVYIEASSLKATGYRLYLFYP